MMLVEYYADEDDVKVPCCPRFPSTHTLSAEPGGFYCYECAEHYGDPVEGGDRK